jgi:chromosome segregation ATPase
MKAAEAIKEEQTSEPVVIEEEGAGEPVVIEEKQTNEPIRAIGPVQKSESTQRVEAKQISEIRLLIDELKKDADAFKARKESFQRTYSEIIGSLDQTQEGYGETLKFFIQKLQKDMTPIKQVNGSLLDLLNSAALFAGKTKQTGRLVESLSTTIEGIERDLTTWGDAIKKEIKDIHQQEGKKLFKGMKFFVLANTAGTIGIFITLFYFFYKTGIFQILNP